MSEADIIEAARAVIRAYEGVTIGEAEADHDRREWPSRLCRQCSREMPSPTVTTLHP